MNPVGRYSSIAQGASPGFIVNQHILSAVGAALPATNTHAESAAPRRRDDTPSCHQKTGLPHSAPTKCLRYQNRLHYWDTRKMIPKINPSSSQ